MVELEHSTKPLKIKEIYADGTSIRRTPAQERIGTPHPDWSRIDTWGFPVRSPQRPHSAREAADHDQADRADQELPGRDRQPGDVAEADGADAAAARGRVMIRKIVRTYTWNKNEVAEALIAQLNFKDVPAPVYCGNAGS